MNNEIINNIINAFVKSIADEVCKQVELDNRQLKQDLENKINELIDKKIQSDDFRGFIVDEVSAQFEDFDTSNIEETIKSNLDIYSEVKECVNNLQFNITAE